MTRKIDMQKGPNLETVLKRRNKSLWQTLGTIKTTTKIEPTKQIRTESITQHQRNAQTS